MNLDTLLEHYFGTMDLSSIEPEQLQTGCSQLALDFGIEREPGRRFALWTLMYMFEMAPEPEQAFEMETERAAARRFARFAAQG